MTISLRLDDRLTRRLAALAKARGISKSELIRKCLSEYLAGQEQEPTAWELGGHLFGCYKSGQGDLSVRAKEVAKERVHAGRANKSRR
jgi:metal-responsive CopG/Arc/MetJ family transcriptional regulator